MLCPGLKIKFHDEQTNEKLEWLYKEGANEYLSEVLGDTPCVPNDPFFGNSQN